MNRTKIEWVKNPDGTQGYTWNPITGCLNHDNGLCKGGGFPCYAYKLANGRLKSRYLANPAEALVASPPIDDRSSPSFYAGVEDPFYPRFWPERLLWLKPRYAGSRHLHTPRGIFVCDMSDLFGQGIPIAWTGAILDAIKLWPEHRFYLLTKQPQNLIKFSPFPDNCWVGVTATDTRMALEACLKLGDIEASVRYLSIEPMLNEINLPPEHLKVCKINQLIIGAQTKPYKPPKIEWVQEIVEAADEAGIPVFLKDNLMPLFQSSVKLVKTPSGLVKAPYGRYEGIMGEPLEFKLRQELPS